MDLKTALKKIEAIKGFEPKTATDRYIREIIDLVSIKSDNFTNTDGISTDKFDVSQFLKRNGISIEDWKKDVGSVKTSEADIVISIAKQYGGEAKNSNEGNDDDELELMELEADALRLKLELLNL